MTIKIGVKVAGFFEMAVVKADGTKKVVAERQPNVILNRWLDIWPGNFWGGGNGTAWPFEYASVGTSGVAVDVTQTELLGFVATCTRSTQSNPMGSSYSGVEPYWAENWKRYTFPIGSFSGEALAEVGLGHVGDMYTRALIKDGAGNPITITILSDEQLELTYYFRVYPPVGDVVTVHNGITCTTRAYDANSTKWCYGNYFDSNGGQAEQMNLQVRNFYSAMTLSDYGGNHGGSGTTGTLGAQTYSRAGDNRSLTVNISLTTAQGNGTWQGLTWGSYGTTTGSPGTTKPAVGTHFQTLFSPAVTKTSLDTMQLGITVHWDRY
jgi:hypothetical protein